jgi:hypothetical protein
LIVLRFVICVRKWDDSALHSKLRDVLSKGTVPELESEEPTGLTDNESDNEESEEVIDFAEESTEPTEN